MSKRLIRMALEGLLLVLVIIGAVKLLEIGYDKYNQSVYPMKYTEMIDAACRENRLDPALVYAVVKCESGFDPTAVSSVDARGLMQLTADAFDWVQQRKGTEPRLTQDQLFDPQVNIEHGTYMLRLLLDEFGTVDNALAAYHGGWGSVKKWLADPNYSADGRNIDHIPFDDTRAYVKKVKATMEKYRELYDI